MFQYIKQVKYGIELKVAVLSLTSGRKGKDLFVEVFIS